MTNTELPYDEAEDVYTLPSGRQIHANQGILGLQPPTNTINDDWPSVFDGYDGKAWSHVSSTPLSREDRMALADMMIGRWTRWRDDA